MRVAFVGKGGSGKSTICAAFVKELLRRKERCLVIDADINTHLAGLLGVEHPAHLRISHDSCVEHIRTILRGTNKHILSSKHMVKTTPPGEGSHRILINSADPILKGYASPFGGSAYFLEVGTYESDGIGASCYHSDLSVFENILSHLDEGSGWAVADMVAGTDAFSNTLHAQFDVIVFVVEPTQESITVLKKYRELAMSARVLDRMVIVGNKMEDGDLDFLESQGIRPAVMVLYDPAIKRIRQMGSSAWDEVSSFSVIPSLLQVVQGMRCDSKLREEYLRELHRTYSDQDYIKATLGDLRGQLGDS